MITILAEKPDVAKKIAKVFSTNSKKEDGYLLIDYQGQPCAITWGIGHLCELKQAYEYDPSYKNWSNLPLPFIPNPYELKVKDNSGIKKQFNIVKELFNKSSIIINATDPDREGEHIFGSIYEMTKTKTPFKRVHFTSQTDEGFKDAFAKLKDASEVWHMMQAGKARQEADKCIGDNLTVAVTLKNNTGEVYHIGRVQTPTLNMVVERTLAIKQFKPIPYYIIDTEFTTTKGETYKAEHTSKRFEKREDALVLLNKIQGKSGTITDIVKKQEKVSAPSLYSLTSLQMDANKKYGYSADETLKIAQELYEAGFTTYPRTDSQYLTEDMQPVVNRVLDMLEKTSYQSLIHGMPRQYERKRYFDNAKVLSHFAIIPTHVEVKNLTLSQQKIYDLIARSVIMMLYPDAIYEKTTVTTTVEQESFITKGSALLSEGWMKVSGKPNIKLLPLLQQNEVVTGSYQIKDKLTEPPKPYTEATLLAAMKSAGKDIEDKQLKKILEDPSVSGIGTSATRASIIKLLFERGYIKKEGKIIAATEKGISLMQNIPIEEVKSAELTARWEQRLQNISLGKDTYNDFMDDIKKTITTWCQTIQNTTSTLSASVSTNNKTNPNTFLCPKCNHPLYLHKWGWGCTNYKNGCKFSISNNIAGKKITESIAKELIEKRETKELSGFISKKNKPFKAKLKVNGDKIEFVF